MHRISWSSAAAALIAGLVVLAGCSTGSTTRATGPPKGGGTATVRLASDWGILNLSDTQLTADAQTVLTAFYDRLVVLDNGKVIPYLASSWTTTATRITFKLRGDAVCSDGTPVTATVVKNSLQPFTVSPPGKRLFGSAPVSIAADNASHTVTFTLPAPNTDAIFGFTQPQAGIVCPAGLVNSRVVQAQQTFGSGPYTMQSAVHGDNLTAKLRTDWKWGPAGSSSATLPSTVVFKVISNNTTATNLLQTGGLDIALISGQEVSHAASIKSLTHTHAHSYYVFPLSINELPGHPGQDQAVRQAIITAFDPASWSQAATAGNDIVGNTFQTKDAQCYNASAGSLAPKHSVAAAQQVLKDAGYTLGSDGKFSKSGKPLTLNVLASTDEGSGPDYEATTFNAVGFTVNMNVPEPATFGKFAIALNFDIFVAYHDSSAIPGVTQNLGFLLGTRLPTEGGTNYGTITDPQITALYSSALSATTVPEKCSFINQIQAALWKNWYTEPVAAATYDWFTLGWNIVTNTNVLETWSLRRSG